MSLADLEATLFIEEPPEIELVDGLFRVTQRVGNIKLVGVMQPSIFAQGVWRCEQALSSFRSGANVTEFRRKVPPEEIATG